MAMYSTKEGKHLFDSAWYKHIINRIRYKHLYHRARYIEQSILYVNNMYETMDFYAYLPEVILSQVAILTGMIMSHFEL